MPIKFAPSYTLTPKIATCLMRIEAIKERVAHLPLTPVVLRSLRETARLFTTHYSTMIEGNQLGPDQIKEVLKHGGHFPGRERDELEIKGYYAALDQAEKWAAGQTSVTEKSIQTLHALVMAGGKTAIKPTKYRDGQNVIHDARTKAIIYMPPEAKDVGELMAALTAWINQSTQLPCPLVAAIAQYQFATIHPYYDGNGRTARLLTTFVLHRGSYDLKGLYSLEEYYARDLGNYYEALTIGESHNYYLGREKADITKDITKWIEYFIEGMMVSFENVLKHMAAVQSSTDQSHLIRSLDARQRRVLQLFEEFDVITSQQIGELFSFKPRTSSALCSQWVKEGFLAIADSAKKSRKYRLSKKYVTLLA